MALKDGARNFVNAIKALIETKQDKLTGTEGQVVGFDADGNPIAQAAPEGGVTSFNGRTGAITPQDGDYTAEQVGALPITGGTMSGVIKLGTSTEAASIHAAKFASYCIASPVPSDLSLLRFSVGKGSINGGIYFSTSANDISEENSTFISGVKTPVNDHEAANKKYVDDAISQIPEGGVTSFNGRTGAVTPASGDYTAAQVGALPISGGTLGGSLNISGNLTLKGGKNYGTQINLGDSDYVHIAEPTDDCLEIKAKRVNFVISDTSNAGFTLNGEAIGGSSGGSSNILTGTYTGNYEKPSYDSAAQATRLINIGARPKIVFVGTVTQTARDLPWFEEYYTDVQLAYTSYAAYAYDGYPFKSTQNATGVALLEITSNGFYVRNTSTVGASANLNRTGYTYAYLAIC